MKNIFKQFSVKLFGKQLRKPSGFMGKKVGNKMNAVNAFMYNETVECMKLQPNDNILEIGYGNGKLFHKIFSVTDGIKISGIDYSKKMYAEACRNNKDAVAAGRLDLYFGNSNNLSFADNSFNKIFCINVIYFWDNPPKHLQEIKRVLKTGGLFYTTIRIKEDMLKMPFTKNGFTLYSAGEWKNILEENNFSVTEIRKITEPPVELNGKIFQLNSLCIASEKR